jgi:hypothetical protein
MKRPEDELGRLSRGIPLWLAETLLFSSNWSSSTAIATLKREHYGLFNADWAPEHIRQLVDNTEGGIDYVFTGALRQKNADYELVLRLWEVKKFRERKTFTVRWTPATADQALAEFHTQWCAFMEFAACPAGRMSGTTSRHSALVSPSSLSRNRSSRPRKRSCQPSWLDAWAPARRDRILRRCWR